MDLVSADERRTFAAPSASDVFFELAAELVDGGLDRPGRSIRQAADRRSRNGADRVGDLEQQIDIAQFASAISDPFEDLGRPGRPFATGCALPARFVGKESACVIQDIDHAGRIVDDNHRRCPQPQAAYAPWPVEIERSIEFCVGHEAHAQTARDHRLGLATMPYAARMFIDQFSRSDTKRQFDESRLIDVTTNAVKLWTIGPCIARIVRILGDTHALKPFGTLGKDMRHTCHGFDIVHDGWTTKRSFDRRKRRLDARPCTLALETFD